MPLLHETARFNTEDTYYVLGGNPNNDGGGVIGTARTLTAANELRDAAIKQNYSKVRVRTWREMMQVNDDEL